MDDISTELNRETLAAVFQGEIIIPSIVQSRRAEQVGVTAIGELFVLEDQVRLQF